MRLEERRFKSMTNNRRPCSSSLGRARSSTLQIFASRSIRGVCSLEPKALKPMQASSARFK
eukprot:9953217-Heterocapsa_arctica.AAC.1